ILREVWGPAYREESNYLHVYVSQLRRKIEPDPARPRYILNQAGVGYRLLGPTAAPASDLESRFRPSNLPFEVCSGVIALVRSAGTAACSSSSTRVPSRWTPSRSPVGSPPTTTRL